LLEPKLILDEYEGTDPSDKWCAQWYPKVTVQLWYSTGTTANVALEGSVDGVHWEEVDAGGDNVSLLKNGTEWYLYYRVRIDANDRKISAIIGAGGA